MDTLTRPLPYYPFLGGWTVVILAVPAAWWSPMVDVELFSLGGLAYLALAFWGGTIIGLGAFALNEMVYRGMARLRGRELP